MNTQTATNTAITPYVINATELEKFGLRQKMNLRFRPLQSVLMPATRTRCISLAVMLPKILQLMQIACWNRSEIKIWMTLALS